jgi:hypothetical protein
LTARIASTIADLSPFAACRTENCGIKLLFSGSYWIWVCCFATPKIIGAFVCACGSAGAIPVIESTFLNVASCIADTVFKERPFASFDAVLLSPCAIITVKVAGFYVARLLADRISDPCVIATG